MGKPTREAILEEMRRTAALNGGRPLEPRSFHDATGLSDEDWGEYWPRYGDLQREAGFAPAWGQLDLRFEEASRMLDERLADVVRREAALGQNEERLREAFARVDAEREATGHRETAVNNREAALNDREAALARKEQELQQAPAPDPAESEQAQQALAERTAELAQREATLVELAQRVQRSLAETTAQRSQLEQGRADVEEAHHKLAEAERLLEERFADITQREAALAQQQQEPQPPLSSEEQAELEQLRHRNEELRTALDERETAVAQRDAALLQSNDVLLQTKDVLAQKERELQQALAQVAQAESGQADLVRSEQARRELAALLAGVAERERAVAERESHLDQALAQTGEALDLEARAQWLTDAVKTAARQEAETVLKEAREEAQRILSDARSGRPFPALPNQPD